MKQNKNNRFAALLLALCMAVCCALPALAAPAASANIDLSRTGSMDVTLYDHQNDVPLRGGALTVYKVADVARTNGDLHFVYTADFTGCGIALGDLTDSTLASRLEAKLPARAAGTTHKISEQGIVSFDALPLGLYLVVQTENSKGYEAINSFLVSLPMADESGWLYTVDATPKVGAPTQEVTPPEPETPSTPSEPGKPSEPEKPSPKHGGQGAGRERAQLHGRGSGRPAGLRCGLLPCHPRKPAAGRQRRAGQDPCRPCHCRGGAAAEL